LVKCLGLVNKGWDKSLIEGYLFLGEILLKNSIEVSSLIDSVRRFVLEYVDKNFRSS